VSLKRLLSLFLLLLIHLFIPVLLLIWMSFIKNVRIVDFFMKTILTGLYFLLIYFSGFWGYFTYYLRYLFIILYSILVARSFFYFDRINSLISKSNPPHIILFIEVGLIFILSYYIYISLKAYSYDIKGINLDFPFNNGIYSIIWGGNSVVSPTMNRHYHHSLYKKIGIHDKTKYAVDITKLNGFGTSALGLLPKINEAYSIFQEEVYSPCDGKVLKVVNHIHENIPFSGIYPKDLGNRILIKTSEFIIMICHFQNGSIVVKEGDQIKKGALLGQVGNSGWSDQPHLHIQANHIDDSTSIGEGIPIFFDGKNPIKNTLFFK
jgi:hypothetical protein